MKLILLSSAQDLVDEVAILHQLFMAGLRTFHLRKPEFSNSLLRQYIQKISVDFRQYVVVHTDSLSLVQQFDLKGIHLTGKAQQSRLYSDKCTSVLSPWYRSCSCHSFKDVIAAEKTKLQYIFLSPIFNSISKQNYYSCFSAESLIQFFATRTSVWQHKTKIIALGGVDQSNISKCREMGFAGVAVLGAVWGCSNPVNSFKTIQNKCR